MGIDITRKNEDRLRAIAEAEGVSVDDYVERLMDEREEIAAIVKRASARLTLSPDDARAKIERGFLQADQGDVVDGEPFTEDLLTELDHLEHTRKAG